MENKERGMSLIVKTVTGWLKGFIFLYGLYVLLTGHLTHGGGFPGGVIMGATFILITLAFGKERSLRTLSKLRASQLASLGALLLVFLAMAGAYFGDGFGDNFIEKKHPSANFEFLSAGTIPLSNICVGLLVSASLYMVFIIIAVKRVVTVNGKRKMIQ